MIDFLPAISTPISVKQAREMNTLVLAFVGDSVQTLFVRTRNSLVTDCKTNALNKLTANEIRATHQAADAAKWLNVLTEEENDIFRRAKNAKKASKAKSATSEEYAYSNGFEAVTGYLYLTGQHERLLTLLTLNTTEASL